MIYILMMIFKTAIIATVIAIISALGLFAMKAI